MEAREEHEAVHQEPEKVKEKLEEEEESKIRIASLTKKPGRRRITLDPCSPPKAKGVVELYTTILGVQPPEDIEEIEKKTVGRHYLEAYQRIRQRVFPRISEYGYNE